jgi:hypothetical protein
VFMRACCREGGDDAIDAFEGRWASASQVVKVFRWHPAKSSLR